MTNVLDVRIVDDGDAMPFQDIFDGPGLENASLDRAVVMEKLTQQDKAGVVLLGRLPDGRHVRLLVTANIIDMLAGAVRGACMRWGQWK